jgi:N-acetylneuraminic acid mutarotase
LNSVEKYIVKEDKWM